MTDEPKNVYRVKPGRVFGKHDEYKPGDEVELTEEEAQGFLDKLELVESAKSVAKPASRRVTTTKKKTE